MTEFVHTHGKNPGLQVTMGWVSVFLLVLYSNLKASQCQAMSSPYPSLPALQHLPHMLGRR